MDDFHLSACQRWLWSNWQALHNVSTSPFQKLSQSQIFPTSFPFCQRQDTKIALSQDKITPNCFFFVTSFFGQTIVFCNLLVSVLKVFQKSYNEKVVVRTNDFSPGNNNQLPVQDYDFSQQTWGAKKQILFNKGNYCLFQANPTSLSLFFFSCFLGKKFTSPRSKFLRLDVYTTSFKTEDFSRKGSV